jgi:nuclear cap-binding protein subunit 1
VPFPHEPLLCEAVFGQMLRVPAPTLRPVAYSTLMVDLCKLLRAFPRAMSGCVRCAAAASCTCAGLGTHLAQRASMHA